MKKNFKRRDNFIHYSKWDETILTMEANIEDVLKAQDKETQKKKKVEKDKGVKESFDPNDFMAAMSRGAEMS